MFLGIHLASEPLSLGLVDQNGVAIGGIFLRTNHTFSENLIDEIDKLLTLNRFSIRDVQGLGVSTGPGSYTGLRIGVTVSKTFCQFQDIPLYGFSTLEAFVYPYRGFDGVYLAVLPSIRTEMNAALFAVHNHEVRRLTADFSTSSQGLSERLAQFHDTIFVIGQTDDMIKNEIAAHPYLRFISSTYLYGIALAEMALDAFRNNLNGDYRNVMPSYSHLPNIIVKKSG